MHQGMKNVWIIVLLILPLAGDVKVQGKKDQTVKSEIIRQGIFV
jgi:hypothetical protein